MKNKKWIKLVGKVLVVISFFYIVRTIWISRESIVVSLNERSIFLLLLFSLAVAGNIILYAFLYCALVSAIADKKIPSRQIIPAYAEANLYKYLPGNIMHYVGRNKIAADGIVTYEQVNVSSVVEILINVCSSAIVGAVFSGKYLFTYLTTYIQMQWVVTIAIAGIAVVLVGMIFFRAKLVKIGKSILNRRTLKVMLVMLSINLLWNVLGNAVFTLLLHTMGGTITQESILPIIGVSALSWLIGFMTPGAPGGIGIREAMLHLLLSGLVPTWMVAAAGVLTRISQVIGEIVAYWAVQIIYNIYKRK